MRVYGRVNLGNGPDGLPILRWRVVETDPVTGDNSKVYLTALCQCLKLNVNESHFWANFGIPAKQSVITQVAPDLYVAFIQQFFSSFFASLTIARQPGNPPTYVVSIITKYGAKLNERIPVPQ